MSSQLLTVRETNESTGAAQGTTVGGSKPLHRFLKGQPKLIGTIVLILGTCLITVTIAMTPGHYYGSIWTVIPPGIFLGTLFTIGGVLFILTEHKPTKKTVTISLALSVIIILVASWTLLHVIGDIAFYASVGHNDYDMDHNETESEGLTLSYHNLGLTIEVLFVIHSIVGAIIFIIMSVLAGAALRSTKTQTVVVMSSISDEVPVE